MSFYKYTSGTKYFLENEEYDGFGAETFSMYQDDFLADFYISKCIKDSTKEVGILRFYKTYSKSDTIVNKCK